MKPVAQSLCLVLAGMVAATALASHAEAAEVGDPAMGLAYAERNCSECHAISGTATESPVPEAPAWAAVANASSTTETSLYAFLQTPHPNMPNFILQPEDMRNVVAYILSLKD